MGRAKYGFSISHMTGWNRMSETDFNISYVDIMSKLKLTFDLEPVELYIEDNGQGRLHLHGIVTMPSKIKFKQVYDYVHEGQTYNCNFKVLKTDWSLETWRAYAKKSGKIWVLHSMRESLKNWDRYMDEYIEINKSDFYPYTVRRL